MKIEKNVTHFILTDDSGNRWEKDSDGNIKKDEKGKQIALVSRKAYRTRKNAMTAMNTKQGKK